MPDQKISADSLIVPAALDYLPIVPAAGGANNRVTVSTLLNLVPGFATTATAAATTTLTVASKGTQAFTGSTTQIVTLPVVTTLPQTGFQFVVINDSSGAVTVNSSGANAVQVMAAGTRATFTCKLLTGTDAASWAVNYSGAIVATGKSLTASNSLTLAGTDATTLTFPSTSATIARIDAGQTFTGNQTLAGDLLFSADNARDIGASGATRARVIYAGTRIESPQINLTTTLVLGGGSEVRFTTGGSGLLKLADAAGTSFGLLQFGGSTSSFPALKRSTTTLQVRLADDSAYTAIDAGSLLITGVGVYQSGTPSIAGNATLNTGSKDSAGKITSTGTGASTAVITFATAFTRAPACFVTNETTANLVRPVSTTTTLTINATVVTGDSLSYVCLGY